MLRHTRRWVNTAGWLLRHNFNTTLELRVMLSQLVVFFFAMSCENRNRLWNKWLWWHWKPLLCHWDHMQCLAGIHWTRWSQFVVCMNNESEWWLICNNLASLTFERKPDSSIIQCCFCFTHFSAPKIARRRMSTVWLKSYTHESFQPVHSAESECTSRIRNWKINELKHKSKPEKQDHKIEYRMKTQNIKR